MDLRSHVGFGDSLLKTWLKVESKGKVLTGTALERKEKEDEDEDVGG
jgi:hypothetical protein